MHAQFARQVCRTARPRPFWQLLRPFWSTGPMENLSLSVPDLLTTVKQFVQPEKHEQLDQMLQRYMQKELGKQQVRSR